MENQHEYLDHNHGGEIFDIPEAERAQVLDFSININPLGLSPRGKKAVLAALDTDAGRYPDSACGALKRALARRYEIPETMLVCGNGATELMYALLRTVWPTVVYVPAPSFSEYRFAADAARIPVRAFSLDIQDTLALRDLRFLRDLPMHPVIFLGHPNNPDGQLLPEDAFIQCLAAAEQREGWLVIDESFIDFLGDEWSFRQQVRNHPRLVVLLSLTKFYAVPGLRIGAAVASPALAEALAGAMYPWNVNGIAQRYIAEAVRDVSYMTATREYVKSERARMDALLRRMAGLHVYNGAVNFFLLRLTQGMQGKELAVRLMERHINIRRCFNYEGLDDTFVRVAVRTQSENDRLLTALQEVLGE